MSFKQIPHTLFFALLVLAVLGCGSGKNPASTAGLPEGALGPLQTVEAVLNGVPVTIEVAITPAEQQQGLMYRESMPENHGMLFVYEEPRYLSFWMKNTLIPLDIAYIRKDMTIGNIETMEPHRGPFTPKGYPSRYPSMYALEMNAGWFAENGFAAGDGVELPVDDIQKLVERRM